MASSTHPRRSHHHPNRRPEALTSPHAPPLPLPRRSSYRPKRHDGKTPSHRERPAPPSGPTSKSHSRRVHFDVEEDTTQCMADGDVIITICMLADTESSISSENQSRGSDSSRDTLVIGNPSGEPSILFAAGRAVKGQSAEPRITTSGGWKSEDSESMSSQHTLKGATPSGERSVPCKTVPRTQGDNGTE